VQYPFVARSVLAVHKATSRLRDEERRSREQLTAMTAAPTARDARFMWIDAAVATSRESRAELMLYLERAASALDVLSISGDADMPFAIDVGCE
jgi:hypothetical protein